jgi:myosin heavy subunit
VPHNGFELDGRTYRRGETITIPAGKVVPPEVIVAASGEDWVRWGYNPVEHALPLKIPGLQRPEDLMANPHAVHTAVHEALQKYVSAINYREYRKACGIALVEKATDAEVRAYKMRLTAQESALDPSDAPEIPDTPENRLVKKAAEAEREAEQAIKKLKAVEQKLKEVSRKKGVVHVEDHEKAVKRLEREKLMLQEAKRRRQEAERQRQEAERQKQLYARLVDLTFNNKLEAAAQVREHLDAGRLDEAEALLKKHGH